MWLQKDFNAQRQDQGCGAGVVRSRRFLGGVGVECFVRKSAFSDFGGKMGFLGHDFGSRHARKSRKGSIDAGDHLVLKKRLSQNFGPLNWHLRPVKVGQKTKNTPNL